MIFNHKEISLKIRILDVIRHIRKLFCIYLYFRTILFNKIHFEFIKIMEDSFSMLIRKKREQDLLIYLSMVYGPRLEFVRKAETVNARKHYTVHGYMIGILNFLFIFRSLFYLRMWYTEEDLYFTIFLIHL